MKGLVRGAAAGRCPQPGEKSEAWIAGKPRARRPKGVTPMTKKAARKQKGSPAQRSAPERKASGRQSPQGKGNRQGADLRVKNPDAAGIDVGARVHYVAVPEDVLWFAS
jgi:hypothetical protein